jgi:hypothetical protein
VTEDAEGSGEQRFVDPVDDRSLGDEVRDDRLRSCESNGVHVVSPSMV